MGDLGKFLILTGGILVGLGVLLLVVGKVPWLGRLPGDLVIERERFTFYFPLMTSVLLSLLLTLVLWVIGKWR